MAGSISSSVYQTMRGKGWAIPSKERGCRLAYSIFARIGSQPEPREKLEGLVSGSVHGSCLDQHCNVTDNKVNSYCRQIIAP